MGFGVGHKTLKKYGISYGCIGVVSGCFRGQGKGSIYEYLRIYIYACIDIYRILYVPWMVWEWKLDQIGVNSTRRPGSR